LQSCGAVGIAHVFGVHLRSSSDGLKLMLVAVLGVVEVQSVVRDAIGEVRTRPPSEL